MVTITGTNRMWFQVSEAFFSTIYQVEIQAWSIIKYLPCCGFVANMPQRQEIRYFYDMEN